MVVFKLERERPAHAIAGNILYYVKVIYPKPTVSDINRSKTDSENFTFGFRPVLGF